MMRKGKRNRHHNNYRKTLNGFVRIRVRSRHERCPRCKKIRLWWAPKYRNKIGPRTIDGQKVCWVCWKRSEYGQVEEIINV
jgi:hypothetical protein